jgi:hypothetical protein
MTLRHPPALAIACGFLALPAGRAGGQQARVVVTPTAVHASIPVGSGPFRWDLASTGDERLEYEWQIAVASGAHHYTFGFNLFKHAHARPRTGPLDALLRAGQATVWQVTDSGGTALPGWDISIVARPPAIEIVVRGAKAVKTLFGTLPPTVSVHALTPERRRDDQVTVEYRGTSRRDHPAGSADQPGADRTPWRTRSPRDQ